MPPESRGSVTILQRLAVFTLREASMFGIWSPDVVLASHSALAANPRALPYLIQINFDRRSAVKAKMTRRSMAVSAIGRLIFVLLMWVPFAAMAQDSPP